MKRFPLALAAGLIFAAPSPGRAGTEDASPDLRRSPLFVSGAGSHHTYRIPALISTGKGTLLAFCEGRKLSSSDTGDIDLLLRRSVDGGRTWSDPRAIWDDGPNTCGNPCPVVDGKSGQIRLLLTWNRGDDHEREIIAGTSKDTRRVFLSSSGDDGATWSAPREITAAVKRPDWTWYATGPGNGIGIRSGPHEGRLIVPCDHIEAGTRRYFSHAILSDDGGESWRLGGSSPRDGVNECAVAELAGGRLLLNMRNYERAKTVRAVSTSDDGGATWKDQGWDEVLIEPICQASLVRASWPEGGRPGILLFSNPASRKREKLTVRRSGDDGRTWPAAKVLHAGPAAYSSLAVLPGGTAGCLFECGEKGPYERIDLALFPLSFLDGR